MEKYFDSEKSGLLSVFIAGALWGIIGVFVVEMAACGADSSFISFLRVFFAAVILVVITICRYGVKGLRIGKKALASCALLGLICQGIYNAFYTLAIMKAGVTISAVLLNVAPLFTAIISYILFSERIGKEKMIALVINVLGCTLTATGGDFSFESVSVIGILFGIGAGFCYSLTAIIGRIAGSETNAFAVSTYSYLFAAAFLFLFMKPWKMTYHVTAELLVWGFLFALISTAIAYLFYYHGVQKISESSKVPVIASIETVVATAVGVFLYRENIGIIHYIGIAFVMISIVMMSHSGKRRRKAE